MEKSTRSKYKMALVEWQDAESVDDWTSEDEIDHSIAPVFSVGWLLKEDFEAITLALNHDRKNDSFSCIMKIPTGMVISKKILKS